MSNPDASQRRVMTRKVRWIAGLLSLLLAVTGGLSGRAADAVESSRDVLVGALVDSDRAERIETSDLGTMASELFGPVMEFERELETEGSEAHASGLPVTGFLAGTRSARAGANENQGPASLEAGTAFAPRAPPIA